MADERGQGDKLALPCRTVKACPVKVRPRGSGAEPPQGVAVQSDGGTTEVSVKGNDLRSCIVGSGDSLRKTKGLHVHFNEIGVEWITPEGVVTTEKTSNEDVDRDGTISSIVGSRRNAKLPNSEGPLSRA